MIERVRYYTKVLTVKTTLQHLLFQINFLPTLEKMTYTDYFYINPAGFPSQCVVKCTGRSTAPQIQLSTNLLSYKYTEVGREVKQFLTISNVSNVKTYYQIVLDSAESVFAVDQSCGKLDGKEEKTILVKFLPLKAIPYYKRVTILLHRQEPLFLDLLGSGFTNDIRPAKLGAQDLGKFNDKIRSGLSVYPPDVQSTMLTSDKSTLVPGTAPEDLSPCLQYFTDTQVGSRGNLFKSSFPRVGCLYQTPPVFNIFTCS